MYSALLVHSQCCQLVIALQMSGYIGHFGHSDEMYSVIAGENYIQAARKGASNYVPWKVGLLFV